VLTPGDYNQDGFVNAADYGAWRSEFSQDVFHHGSLIADGNADGFVDAADYVIWRANVAGGAAGVSAAAVPEPVSLSLLIVACANFSWFYRRSRCRAQ
jgi:hypothetical protein